jgi:hypothetical protein
LLLSPLDQMNIIKVPTMGKDNKRAPDFNVPIPYIFGDEKEADPYDGKPPSLSQAIAIARRFRQVN